jgi:hypothetical protein
LLQNHQTFNSICIAWFYSFTQIMHLSWEMPKTQPIMIPFHSSPTTKMTPAKPCHSPAMPFQFSRVIPTIPRYLSSGLSN